MKALNRGIHSVVAVKGVGPVAALVPVFPACTYRHYGGTTDLLILEIPGMLDAKPLGRLSSHTKTLMLRLMSRKEALPSPSLSWAQVVNEK